MDISQRVALWSTAVGFLLPLVIAMITQEHWHPRAKGIVAFVVCLIAAAGTAFFNGELDNIEDVATAFLIVFAATITTYHQFWKPTTIAPVLERATTL